MVAPTPPSAELPALYRAVLDGVAALERHGARALAASLRRQAIAAYSSSWDDRHRERLASLYERIQRELTRDAAPQRTAERRLVPAVDR